MPDLRSKHIRATTSANIGLYNDLYVTDVNGNQVTKAGAGLDVIQNIDSPFKLTYNGEFYIPPQTSNLRGEPGFTLETGAYTYETGVQNNMFQPHLHRTTTTRARQKTEMVMILDLHKIILKDQTLHLMFVCGGQIRDKCCAIGK